ncbi:MAG: HipA N-terminal domain-containing protein, partial [Acidimicrobiales bacterium]
MAYRHADTVEVRVWGAFVGPVLLDPATGFYAFEYDDAWLRRGIELSPLVMPNRPG